MTTNCISTYIPSVSLVPTPTSLRGLTQCANEVVMVVAALPNFKAHSVSNTLKSSISSAVEPDYPDTLVPEAGRI